MLRLITGGLYPLWRWLCSPWLLFLGGGVGLVLALAARALPQLPGQLLDEPATAARWMQEMSANYGVWGNLWLALGLFDVLHSPLLYVALALCIPPLVAQLIAEVAGVLQHTSLPTALLQAPQVNAGEAIILPVDYALRRRFLAARQQDAVATLAGVIASSDLQTYSQRVPLQTVILDNPSAENDPAKPAEEVRFAALRSPRSMFLRPLLALGLLIAVVSLWSSLVLGWQVAVPPLAPGATYRTIGHALALAYTPSLSPTVPSLLNVDFDGQQFSLPVDRAQRQSVGTATLTLAPSFPALWISTVDGAAQLSLPGRSEREASLGLVFTGDTTEESVLLPGLGAGLRVIQRTDLDPGFVLELYRSDEVQPVYRAELPSSGRVLIPLARTSLELIVITLPGLLVNIRYHPNLWLAWVGLTLALAGAAAHLIPVGWLAAQIAPWPLDRSVVVLQGSDRRWVEDVTRQLQAAPEIAAPVLDAPNA